MTQLTLTNIKRPGSDQLESVTVENGVIKGWTEGVQLMRDGERMRFWIPQRLAYDGKAGAPAGMLVFDIELISFK